MYTIIDGKNLSKKIRENLKYEVEKLKEKQITPKLAVIMVGEDQASKVYVKNKSKACSQTGVEFEEIILKEETTMQELQNIIQTLNNRKDINGILLQSPLPKHLNEQKAFEFINYKKDVDGFNILNVGKLATGQEDGFVSCTPLRYCKNVRRI